MNNNVKLFYEWYIDWYKTNIKDITVIISLPNELQPYKEDNVVILDLFNPNNDFVDSEPYLKSLLEKADELGIIIYLDVNPKYKKYGFELTPNNKFLKRLPK